jgi:hypothetical protein
MMNQILELLNAQMERPIAYQSWFHYVFLLLVFLIAGYATMRLRHASKERIRIFVLTIGLIMLILEIYKQINFSYTNAWRYRWYAFPFQFCSTPMYVAIMAGWLKNERFRNVLYGFLATYGLFAGILVMFIPHDVFTTTIGINIQTMVHHGGAAIMGSVLLFSDIPWKRSRFSRIVLVYLVVVAIAMSLNLWHNRYVQDGTFNMFFLNPRHGIHIDWIKPIYDRLSYGPYFLIYVFGFTLISYGIYVLGKTIRNLLGRGAFKRKKEVIPCSN